MIEDQESDLDGVRYLWEYDPMDPSPKTCWRSSRSSMAGDWPEESPLHVLGYRVGRSGERQSVRRQILRQAFKCDLPIVNSPAYMQSWGEPGSATRLKKIADNISTACRNMRKRSNASEQAVEDWESDLEWLHDEFYHGHFRFCSPNAYV